MAAITLLDVIHYLHNEIEDPVRLSEIKHARSNDPKVIKWFQKMVLILDALGPADPDDDAEWALQQKQNVVTPVVARALIWTGTLNPASLSLAAGDGANVLPPVEMDSCAIRDTDLELKFTADKIPFGLAIVYLFDEKNRNQLIGEQLVCVPHYDKQRTVDVPLKSFSAWNSDRTVTCEVLPANLENKQHFTRYREEIEKLSNDNSILADLREDLVRFLKVLQSGV